MKKEKEIAEFTPFFTFESNFFKKITKRNIFHIISRKLCFHRNNWFKQNNTLKPFPGHYILYVFLEYGRVESANPYEIIDFIISLTFHRIHIFMDFPMNKIFLMIPGKWKSVHPPGWKCIVIPIEFNHFWETISYPNVGSYGNIISNNFNGFHKFT